MWRTNLKVVLVVLVTVSAYTAVANWIPQIESEVPETLSFSGDVTADELVDQVTVLEERKQLLNCRMLAFCAVINCRCGHREIFY